MDDAGPRALFVVVSYEWNARYFSSILQLDLKGNKYEYVAKFAQPLGYPEGVRWVFACLPSSAEGHLPFSPEDLCMVPDWGTVLYQKRPPLLGFVFNLRTKELNPFKPPGGARYYEHVVDLGGDIYFMGAPKANYEIGFFFARYNRLQHSWKSLKHFPYDDIKYSGDGLIGFIVATAVWNNTILLTMDGCGMWAYDVCTDKWYRVYEHGFDSDDIAGKAVVLGDTIYALAKEERSVIFFLSIKSEKIEGGLEFKCSLLCRNCVPGMDVVRYDFGLTWMITRDLVHLGGDNFCIVGSCNSFDDSTFASQQPIQVTYLKKHHRRYSMTVTCQRIHNIDLLQNEQFKVELCFSLPEDKATAFKEANIFFAFDPFPEHYVTRPAFRYQDPPSVEVDFFCEPLENDSAQTNTIGEQGYATEIPLGAVVKQSERLELGCSIKQLVESLGDSWDSEATVEPLAEGLFNSLYSDALVNQLAERLRDSWDPDATVTLRVERPSWDSDATVKQLAVKQLAEILGDSWHSEATVEQLAGRLLDSLDSDALVNQLAERLRDSWYPDATVKQLVERLGDSWYSDATVNRLAVKQLAVKQLAETLEDCFADYNEGNEALSNIQSGRKEVSHVQKKKKKKKKSQVASVLETRRHGSERY